MKIILMLLVCCQVIAQEPLSTGKKGSDVDVALQKLIDGNQRFQSGQWTHKNLNAEARSTLKSTQEPFAAIVGCSDSRVPPDLIFDQGLGDLFVVRIAGNVIGSIELDSVAYAVSQLRVPLIMVLGHENCGAVQGALSEKTKASPSNQIYPLILSGLKQCTLNSEDPLKSAIQCNVKNSVNMLKANANFSKLIKSNKLKIVGAYYDFDLGSVEILAD